MLGVSTSEPPAASIAGTIVAASGGSVARIPWIVTMGPRDTGSLLGAVALSTGTLKPSLANPALLTFRAGSAAAGPDGLVIEPVALLEVELRAANGKRLGLLARLRDLLPGTYGIGLTGRGPDGRILKPGRYVVKLRAFAADAEDEARRPDSVASLELTVRPATP